MVIDELCLGFTLLWCHNQQARAVVGSVNRLS